MDNKPSEFHLRNIMLYEYRLGNSASETASNINSVYPNAISVRKCQRWFSKFRNNNFSLDNQPKPGRPSLKE